MGLFCVTKKPMTLEEFEAAALAYGFARDDELDDGLSGVDGDGDRRSLQDIREVNAHILFKIFGDCEEFAVDVVPTWAEGERQFSRVCGR